MTGVLKLYHLAAWDLFGLAGLRYLDLSETFALNCDIQGVSGPYAGQSGVVHDRFETRNYFSGANFGLRARHLSGPLSVEISGRVALGLNHEVENVAGGFYSYNFTAPYASGPEGVFAQPANEGRTSSDRFAMVPELQLKIGYALSSRLRATLGYDFLYFSNVLRAGDQLNRELPKGQTFNQADPTISSTSPVRLFKTTDFFTHGVSLGLEFVF